MDSLLYFFESMPSWQKLVWIFTCLGISWILEGGFPLVQLNYRKWKHAGVNMVFLASTIVINLLFGLATLGIFDWLGAKHIGLLHLVDFPVWAELLIALLILDLVAQYFVHYLLHKVKWMWKFHMIHHSDTKVDATTGTRHHPGDYVMREVFSLVAVVIAGAPLAFYLFYRIVTVFFTYLTHANIMVPIWLDKPLSYVFVTPNMHKFHHHFERPWTDTNFGNIFSVWDRLFGTLVYDDPGRIRYGLDVLEDHKDEDVVYQLKVPFDPNIKTDY
jgi:sterol desaturase/sphingolipid hydroxylase (fatty acid hydroxylase superfamily)